MGKNSKEVDTYWKRTLKSTRGVHGGNEAEIFIIAILGKK